MWSTLTRPAFGSDAGESSTHADADRFARHIIEQSRQQAGWVNSLGDQRAAATPPASTTSPLQALASKYRELPLPAELPGQSAGLRRSPIQQLEAAIRHSPSLPEFYLRLASLYLESSRDFDAERLLERGQATTDDSRVTELWEEVQLLRMERRFIQAEQNVAIDDSPEVRQALTQVTSERDTLEVRIFSNRLRRDPHSAAVHFQLGLRLKRAGKLREAVQRFQDSLADDHFAAAAALQLGDCLRQEGEIPAALQHYRLAAETAGGEQAELRKQALYESADLAERMRLHRLSQRYLRELQRLDASYRDVSVRIDSVA